MREKRSNRLATRNFFASLVALLSVAIVVQSASAAAPPLRGKAPRLILCINVDQLRTDHLLGFSSLYSNEGWMRLLRQGAVYPSVDFNTYPIDIATAIANIYSGVYPSVHGISSRVAYDDETGRYRSVLEDRSFIGNYTSERYSPMALQSSTIGDELKRASAGRATVYSIAPTAEAAILSAGLEADAAYWIENNRGKWATTTYYTRPMPWFVEKANATGESVGNRFRGKAWRSLREIDYRLLPYATAKASFNHRVGESVELYKQSALVNDDVTDLAISFIEYAGYELASRPNLLSLSYTAAPFASAVDYDMGAEMQDSYVRLDLNLSRLLNAVDRKVGLSDCLVMLSGTGYSSFRVVSSVSANGNRSNRSFSPERCKALLNMFLMAVYGQGQWVNSYRDGYICLNHTLIKERDLSLSAVRGVAARFVSEMAGVESCISTSSEPDRQGTPDRFSNNLYKHDKRDLFVRILSGWHISSAGSEHLGTENDGRYRRELCDAPLIFFGMGVKPMFYANEKPSVKRIAPSLAYVLRIRPPCSSDLPLEAVIDKATYTK